MSGYMGQEPQAPSMGFVRKPAMRIIDNRAVPKLIRDAMADPRGLAARFVQSAADEGWTIDFPDYETAACSYDVIAAAVEGTPVVNEGLLHAYGKLVVSSLGLTAE